MKPIYIFQHEDWIQAGRLIEVLEQKNIDYKVIAIDRGERIPQSTESMSGLVFLGGTMSVNDGYSWIRDEVKLIGKAVAEKLPIMGHCLGAQLISKALGSSIQTMPKNEIGWHPIKAIDNAVSKEWLADIPDQLELLFWHHDEFSMPTKANPIFASAYCKNQAFVQGNIVATIAHIEVTVSMLQHWLTRYGHDIKPNGSSVQTIAAIKKDIGCKVEKMHQLTDRFYHKWLRFLSL